MITDPSDIRHKLHLAIEDYQRIWVDSFQPHETFNLEEEENIIATFRNFVSSTKDCFERSHQSGHITASTIIVSEDFQQVLLTHHKKLGKWLQLGGHADGDPDPARVALKEAEEESGLSKFRFLKFDPEDGSLHRNPIPFDFDRHLIPARKEDPEHFHYDVRYVLVTDSEAPLVMSDESNDLRWFDISEARLINTERSMIRQFDKLDYLSRFNT